MRHPRIETFDLNLLRIFDALYQHGSVIAAATEISVSPSAISHALKRLRYTFDDELFVKERGGMIPTPRATEIAEQVATVLLHVHSLLGPPDFDPEKSERHFRILCSPYVAGLVLPRLIQRLRDQAPQITLSVECRYREGIADKLDTGTVDLVIGSFGRIPERLQSEVLLRDRWTWVLRADHPALSTKFTTETLMKMPQLVLATNEAERSIDGFVSQAGLERLVVADKCFLNTKMAKSRYNPHIRGAVVINSAQAALAILAESDLVGLLPDRITKLMSKTYKVKRIALENEEHLFEHRVVWHRKHGADRAVAWLRSMLRASADSLEKSTTPKGDVALVPVTPETQRVGRAARNGAGEHRG